MDESTAAEQLRMLLDFYDDYIRHHLEIDSYYQFKSDYFDTVMKTDAYLHEQYVNLKQTLEKEGKDLDDLYEELYDKAVRL